MVHTLNAVCREMAHMRIHLRGCKTGRENEPKYEGSQQLASGKLGYRHSSTTADYKKCIFASRHGIIKHSDTLSIQTV